MQHPRPSAPAVPQLRVSMAMAPPAPPPRHTGAACSAEPRFGPRCGEPAGHGVGGNTFAGAALSTPHTPRAGVPVQCLVYETQQGTASPNPCLGVRVPRAMDSQRSGAPRSIRAPVRSGCPRRAGDHAVYRSGCACLTLGSIFLFFGLDHLPAHRPQLGWENPRQRHGFRLDPKNPRAGGAACVRVGGILYAEKAGITPTEGEGRKAERKKERNSGD